MEYQKTMIFLHSTANQTPIYRTKNWVEINDNRKSKT